MRTFNTLLKNKLQNQVNFTLKRGFCIRYTNSHEWVKIDNNFGFVGISNHAQAQLGDIVFVELPKVGEVVEAGQIAV